MGKVELWIELFKGRKIRHVIHDAWQSLRLSEECVYRADIARIVGNIECWGFNRDRSDGADIGSILVPDVDPMNWIIIQEEEL